MSMATSVAKHASSLSFLHSVLSSRGSLWNPLALSEGHTISRVLSVSLQTHSFTSLHTRHPEQRQSFTIDYLINTCGLSPESAATVAQKVQLDSPHRPDAVLAVLRGHGFSRAQICSIVKKRPVLLLAGVESVILPKIRFFLSFGVTEAALARTLASDPTLFTRSLANQLIPTYNALKTILLSDENVVAAFQRTSWIFLADYAKIVAPNVKYLSETGVPEKSVIALLKHYPEAVLTRNKDFRRITEQVKEMGFNPKKSTFVLAIHAFAGNRSTWDKCFEVYQRWGWSEDDIMSAFRKHPHCMILSEKKINAYMEYLVKEMGREPRMMVQIPAMIFFSMEKRIIPRCSVAKVLVSKGLMEPNWRLPTVLIPVEKVFLRKFISKYAEEVPELINVYQGNIHPSQLCHL